MKVKAGYKTSEFWFTLVSFIFSGLFLIGAIGESSYKDELIEQVSHAVESVVLISGQLLILYRYVKGRTDIKKKAEEELVEPIKQPKSTKPSTRKSKKPTAAPKSKTKK